MHSHQEFLRVPRLLSYLSKTMSDSENVQEGLCLILSSYRRSYLFDQLKKIALQQLLPEKILIYSNYHPDSLERDILENIDSPYPNIFITLNKNWNAKFHGRFFAGLSIDASYYIVLDDDVLPYERWFELAFNIVRDGNCIITGNGRRILPDIFTRSNTIAPGENYEEGYEPFCLDIPGLSELYEVDYGGHSWAFSRSSLNAMSSVSPPSLNNSEDFHLSAAAYMVNNTRTLMPRLGIDYRKFWPDVCDYTRAADCNASHKLFGHFTETRFKIISMWVQEGYKPLLRRDYAKEGVSRYIFDAARIQPRVWRASKFS